MSLVSRRLFVLPAVGLAATAVLFAHGASAQAATGTVTGRVLWGNCIRAIPLPAAPDAQAQPGMPQPVPVPAPTTGLPAGAVLVAVQNTAISARTDEAGSFTLSGVPAGQYFTVAAGPVANAASAIAERPNVLVNGGQSTDIGTLSLGGSAVPLGIPCRVVPGVQGAPGVETSPASPEDTTPPMPGTSDSTP